MKRVSVTLFLFVGLILSSCNNINTGEPQKTEKYLFHPKKPEVDLEGSILIVDNGIMLLVQHGPLKEVPTILIPGTDSAGKVMKETYASQIGDSYQMTGGTYVKVAGNFLREDSLKPIFKFNWVVFMDKSSELKEIQEMEE